MIHNMNLNNEPFELIKSGSKTIELRLNDEKRRLLNVGDEILFNNRSNNEKLLVSIIDLHKYDSFKSLYKDFDKVSLVYKEDEISDPRDMNEYYSKEDEERYGVVGIELKLK